jgi:predicted phosphoribosyltransferase
MPTDLWAIGPCYEDFSPTLDEEVEALLAVSAREHRAASRLGKDLHERGV